MCGGEDDAKRPTWPSLPVWFKDDNSSGDFDELLVSLKLELETDFEPNVDVEVEVGEELEAAAG